MPMPVNLIHDQSVQKSTTIDYSFLFAPQPSKINVTASNKDAQLLFDLWAKGTKCKKENTVKIDPSMNVASRDIIRLKSMGLVTGSKDELSFTKKGKYIITTMSLAEQSAFDKVKKNKSYTEILASMNKRGKKGYRSASCGPKFNINTSNNLNLKDIK